MQVNPPPLRCQCDGSFFTTVFTYEKPPQGEISFQFSSRGEYSREIVRCEVCNHFVSVHDMDTTAVYSGDYVTAIYGDEIGIRDTFRRIIELDPSQSDNEGRVRRILEFATAYLPTNIDRLPSVLDVGSGLGVFPYKMKEAGWDCTALDPDIRSIHHIRKTIGVKALHGEFMIAEDIGQFDVVTFNKVLEHVEDPVSMLAKSTMYLFAHGFVYLEVPDGKMAVLDGPEREEFFIDHLHIFSAGSLALLTARAGFFVQNIERIREPSGKYTLRAFLTVCQGNLPHGRDTRERGEE